MNSEKHTKYISGRGETNSFLLEVWANMQAAGELEGLDDDEVLEKVVSKAEKLKEEQS